MSSGQSDPENLSNQGDPVRINIRCGHDAIHFKTDDHDVKLMQYIS
jgi:hypothetical protein